MLRSKKSLQADGKKFPEFFGIFCGGTLLKNTHPKGLFQFLIGVNPAFLDFSGSLRFPCNGTSRPFEDVYCIYSLHQLGIFYCHLSLQEGIAMCCVFLGPEENQRDDLKTDSKVFTSEWKVKVAVFLGDVHPDSVWRIQGTRWKRHTNPLKNKKPPEFLHWLFFLRKTSFQCFNIMTFCATASRPVPVQSRVKRLKTRPFPVEISQCVDGWSAAHRFSVSQVKIGL